MQYTIPGVGCFFYGLATLVWVLTFKTAPNLIFLFPFKVIRLTVIDTRSGITIYTYSWKTKSKNVNDELFSGMIQGISMLVKESLNQGYLREIIVEEGKLILQPIKDTPITCVLVTTRASRTLRDALRTFADQFGEKFTRNFNCTFETSQFDSASELIKTNFAFVPEYD
jgi:hypothetical protein